jgi:myo-inositol-1(or 4)-monophosphatase
MKKSKTIDTQIVDRALRLAVEGHEGTVRKGTNVPYIVHPMEAMVIVSTMTDDQELMAAALLHDAVEDTGITLDDIRRELGPRVAALVDSETDREVEGLSHVESWQHRKQAAVDRLASASRDVQMVALGDKLSNMRAMARHLQEQGDRLWQRFNEKDPARHAWYYRQLVASLAPLSDTAAYREFADLVEQVFPAGGQ